MNLIQRFFQRTNPQSTEPGADIVLGLPLEVDKRLLYPVYLDHRSSANGGSEARQVGYVEVEEGWADYTSLEPDYRWTVAMAGLALLMFAAIWLLRRAIR